METLLLIIGTLAVWRASYMLQNETGPYGIFERLQAWYWTDPHRIGGVKSMLRCFYCLSMWTALPVSLLMSYSDIWFFPVYWFALSAGAILIDKLHNKISE